MRRAVVAIVLLFCLRAEAHVGSPDVFFEGDAGPYRLFVTVRMPQVIPGVAEIEVRSAEAVDGITIVPLRLVGFGADLAPAPDAMKRSETDPQFFTGSLWLMEHGELQVRIAVTGARGAGTMAIPIRAAALRTRGMDRQLGTLLLSLMALLALGLVSIAGAAVREGALDPGVLPDPRRTRRSRIAIAIASALVVAALGFGAWWWREEANQYERFVERPWVLAPQVDGCRLTLPRIDNSLLPDHGHIMHLFVVREPALDRIAHLHPALDADGRFVQDLPALPAGHYRLFADVVTKSGYPVTGVGELDLADLPCGAPAGDDSTWDGTPNPHITWAHGAVKAGVGEPIRIHVTDDAGKLATLEPYMMMAGHAMVVKRDFSVFAHLHPSGTIPMPSLMLAGNMAGMTMEGKLGGDVAFPYGFPSPGSYRVFVQVKRDGRIETAAFDVNVE
jgi:hypothetical protein